MMERVPCNKPRPFGASTSTAGRNRGFTLLEMLIALVILSVSILALTGVTLTAIKVNLENDVRNTAIRLTSERAADLLSQPIGSIVDSPTPSPTRSVNLRGANYLFTESWAVTSLSNDLRQIVITVSYVYQGQTFNNTSVIYKHRAK